jgi:hypothetical protein
MEDAGPLILSGINYVVSRGRVSAERDDGIEAPQRPNREWLLFPSHQRQIGIEGHSRESTPVGLLALPTGGVMSGIQFSGDDIRM